MDLSQPVMTLQLRVLAGLHEGAVVPLQASGELLLAGHGQADVQLRDAPGQARLVATEQGWLWREDGFEQAVQAGQAWRWAGLVLALSAASEPWPDRLPALAFERDGPEARDTNSPAAVPAPGDPPAAEPAEDLKAQEPQKAQELKQAQTEAAPPQAHDTSPQPVRRAQAGLLPAGRAARLALAAAVAVLLILASLVALLLGNEPTRAPTASVAVTTTERTPSLGQVQKVLMDLGLSASVKPRVREDGRLILRGVVADAEQLDALSQAISRLTRRYTPLLLTQSEFEGRVRALAPNLPEGIEAQPQSGGLLVLQARREDVNWVLARQLVDGELPEVVGVEHRAFRPTQEREWVDERRARALPAERITVPAVPPPPPSPSVPWAAVVGGPRPYLVMADGSKWLPGGKMHSLVLVSIDNQFVVFQDAQGRTFSKPR